MALELEDNVEIMLSWNEDVNHLVLTAELGQPKEFHAADAHRMALAYNALWHETGGARVACVDVDGTLALLFELPADGLMVPQLQYTVERMAAVTRQWTRFMAQASDGGGEAMELSRAPLSLMLRA